MGRSKTDTKNLKLLGKRIREVRTDKGLTMNQLALKLGKDRQSIYRVEMGTIDVGYLYLKNLCEGLEISLSDLLKDLE
jgi:transcriptional regulator with XRE-family HTH domain